MASGLMDKDPANWTVTEVKEFFEHHSARYISHIPNRRLPPLEIFLQNLHENDVSGHELLTAVDASFLRQDCDIKSLGIRTTVLDCIGKLRQNSKLYQGRSAPFPSTQPPTPVVDSQALPIREQQNPNIGSNLRQGEVSVEDERGRKRRRLDLGPSQPAQVLRTAAVESFHGYLSDSKCPIDRLFYGRTRLGTEVKSLPLEGDVHIELSQDKDSDQENFQFHGQCEPTGIVRYVYTSLRHLFTNAETIDLQRSQRPAIAVFPYRADAQSGKKPRSATVFSIDSGDRITAYRENAVFLQSSQNYNDEEQASSTAEWDFLLPRYQVDDDEEILVEGRTDSDEELSPSLLDEIEAEKLEMKQIRGVLSPERVDELIDEVIWEQAVNWRRDELPKLEVSRAWTVWRQTKRSRSLRDNLIQQAKNTIACLEARVKKYRIEILKEEWKNETLLKESCKIFDCTVDDMEEQKWRISVWLRSKEPSHIVKHGAHGERHVKDRSSTTQIAAQDRFVPDIDDRFSVEPATPVHTLDNSDRLVVQDEEAANAPLSARTASPILPVDIDLDAEASDEMSPSDTIISNDDEFVVHDVDDAAFTIPQPQVETMNHADKNHTSVINQPEAQTIPATMTPIRDAELSGELSSSGSLPSITELTSSWRKRPKAGPVTPTTGKQNNTKPEPINLLSSDSSDESSTMSSRRKRGRKPGVVVPSPVTTGDPMQASAEVIDSWSYEQLVKGQDSTRILIKALRDAGNDFFQRAHKCWHKLYKSGFKKELPLALKVLRGDGTPDSVGLGQEWADVFLRLSRMAIAFWTKKTEPLDPELDHLIQWQYVPMEDVHQLGLFCDKLRPLLLAKDNRRFAIHDKRRGSSGQLNSSVNPHVVSDSTPVGRHSEDSTGFSDHTPSKTKSRKKLVQESQSGKTKRSKALQRQVEFKMKLETQSSGAGRPLDLLNGHDSSSGIEINPLRDDEQDAIYVHPRIAEKMKQHQIDGVRFLWREIAAVDDEENSQGCLLAHTMGLGKTMQSIALLMAISETARSTTMSKQRQLPPHLQIKAVKKGQRHLRILVLAPSSLLLNWRKEIEIWALDFLGTVISIETSADSARKLQEWYNYGGVLLVGYTMFHGLLGGKRRNCSAEELLHREEVLLQGPELVVADEAHHLKNVKSGIAITAGRIVTQSRIALTGTPMSNDVQEIYSLVSWVAPGYLGDKTEFNALYGLPIEQGTYKDSTKYEQRRSLKKLAVLREQIEPKVSRADITVLRGSLKSKVEYVITVPLTSVQKEAYERCVSALNGTEENQGSVSQVQLFAWLAVLGLLTNHPLPFRRKLLSPPPPTKSRKDLAQGTASNDEGPRTQVSTPEWKDAQALGDEHVYRFGFTEPMVNHIVAGLSDELDPSLSFKASIFLNVLRLSTECGDKVLVFSGSIPSIQYLDEFLRQMRIPFGRIDGGVPIQERGPIIDSFHKGSYDVLLISTRAGGLGLNIQGANRVVIFDFGFNPTWEEQAIGRAYRLGQQKPVYVYRFVAGGTFETNVYNKQLFKTSLAQRVVDKKNPTRHAERNTREWLYEPNPVFQQDLEKWKGKDPHVLDLLIEQQVRGEDIGMRAISTMETLQEEAEDEPLTAEEREEVLRELEEGRSRFNKGRGLNGAVPASTAGLATHGRLQARQLQAVTQAANSLGSSNGVASIHPIQGT